MIRFLLCWQFLLKFYNTICTPGLHSFCSPQTLEGLRVTIRSVLDVMDSMFQQGFKYVLTGKLNQDCLEVRVVTVIAFNRFVKLIMDTFVQKFFGIIRSMGGCEDHPTVLNFAQLFRLLCIYSPTKLRIQGNVENSAEEQVLIEYSACLQQAKSEMQQKRHSLQQGLEDALLEKIVAADSPEVAALGDHDYALPDPRHAIIYHLAGYVAKKAEKFTGCKACLLTLVSDSCPASAVAIVTRSKLIGELKFPSLPLYSLLAFHVEPFVEKKFGSKLSRISPVAEIIENLTELPVAGIGCSDDHALPLVTRLMIFYLSVRVFFFTRRYNLETLPASRLVKCHRKRSKLV